MRTDRRRDGQTDVIELIVAFSNFAEALKKIEHHSHQISSPNFDISQVCCFWRDSLQWAMSSSFTRFLDNTQWHITFGRTPLDEWSARRKDLYLTTHNIHNRQTSMPAVGFESAILAGERPQTYALDRAANGTDISQVHSLNIISTFYSTIAFCPLFFLHIRCFNTHFLVEIPVSPKPLYPACCYLRNSIITSSRGANYGT